MKHELQKIDILLDSLPYGLIFRDSVRVAHPQNWKTYYKAINELVQEGLLIEGLKTKPENGIKYRCLYFSMTVGCLYFLSEIISSPNAESKLKKTGKSLEDYKFLSVIHEVIQSFSLNQDIPLNKTGFYNRNAQFIFSCREQYAQTQKHPNHQ